MSNYSKADRVAQWFANKFRGSNMALTRDNMVVCLHTTEGLTWPDYQGGAVAPTYTGLPPIRLRRGKWRAHFPDEMSARALENDIGGVETNTMNVVQIELVGTCNPVHAKSWNGQGHLKAGRDYVYWPNATDRQKRWVARILADFHKRHGFRLRLAAKFIAYPESYGEHNGVRLTNDQWRAARGVLGHQHVPENVHGDPGNIDAPGILRLARKYVR